MLPGHELNVGITGRCREIRLGGKIACGVQQARRMHRQHQSLARLAKGIRIQHRHRPSRMLALHAQPFIEQGVQNYAVKVNRGGASTAAWPRGVAWANTP